MYIYIGPITRQGLFRRMSEDTVECNCGPDPVCVDETSSPAQVVDEEHLLKMMEEKNKSVIYLYQE